jgi:26S proteasome regulatory subunit T4
MSSTRETLIEKYVKTRQMHDKLDEEVREMRFKKMDKIKEYGKTEDQLKAIQSIGMLIGEVLNKQSDEKFLVKVRPFPLAYLSSLRRF